MSEEPQIDPTPEQQSLPEVVPDAEERRALLEAIVYVADDPLTPSQIAEGLAMPAEQVEADLDALVEASAKRGRGVEVRKLAGGYKMFTKAEHHDTVRKFVKTLQPKLKLSLPALETLAVIAYKQPATVPEIQAIRGVNAAGVIHTLLKHKLVATAGRKKVIGKPMLYKTTREFLVQFGLNDVSELPSLKELEELSRSALGEEEESEVPLEGEPVDAEVETEEAEDKASEGDAETEEETEEREDEREEESPGSSAE